MVIFAYITCERHPIARAKGRGTGCRFRVQTGPKYIAHDKLGAWRPDLSDRGLTMLSDVGLLAQLLVLSDRELLVLPGRGLLISAVVR